MARASGDRVLEHWVRAERASDFLKFQAAGRGPVGSVPDDDRVRSRGRVSRRRRRSSARTAASGLIAMGARRDGGNARHVGAGPRDCARHLGARSVGLDTTFLGGDVPRSDQGLGCARTVSRDRGTVRRLPAPRCGGPCTGRPSPRLPRARGRGSYDLPGRKSGIRRRR